MKIEGLDEKLYTKVEVKEDVVDFIGALYHEHDKTTTNAVNTYHDKELTKKQYGHRNRSFKMLYLICKTAYPKLTLVGFTRALLTASTKYELLGHYCCTVDKIVFGKITKESSKYSYQDMWERKVEPFYKPEGSVQSHDFDRDEDDFEDEFTYEVIEELVEKAKKTI